MIRLSESVERVDVEEAVRLILVLMKVAALDPKTGLFDMDLLNTGISSRQRQNSMAMKRIVRDLLTQHMQNRTDNGGLPKTDLLMLLRTEMGPGLTVTEQDLDAVLRDLEAEDGRVLVRQNMVVMERAN
jgi:DNA replicative helicase MCM subunit Mcm2 (Cdc46/Mcm family)